MGKRVAEDHESEPVIKKKKTKTVVENGDLEHTNGVVKKSKKAVAESPDVADGEVKKKKKKSEPSADESKMLVNQAYEFFYGEKPSKPKKSSEQNGHASPEKPKTKKKSETSTPSAAAADDDEGLLDNFRISDETKQILTAKGITRLFPIQYRTFDHVFDGTDVVGRARTGTGKTLSFALPLVEKMQLGMASRLAFGRAPRVIVMEPTRELARQTAETFEYAGVKLRTTCIYGGAPYGPQERDLRTGIDVVVGTPGRIIDHIERGTLKLDKVEHVVLDEADEMLNFGFAQDIEKILSAIPEGRDKQTLLFSATLPAWVANVAKQHLKPDHVTVDLVGNSKQKSNASIQHLALCCHWTVRANVLADVVKVYCKGGRTIVFADTKAEATDIATKSSLAPICQVLHGDISQSQREVTLDAFRTSKFSVLVATDVAARGLDIPEVDLVIQCQPPRESENYIHRSGRTGRAGRDGVCITFFTNTQSGMLKALERQVGIEFKRVGTPQPGDIIKVQAHLCTQKINEVDPAMLPHFTDLADTLIEAKGATEALAAALAVISGFTKPVVSRSLLSSMEGYTTIRVNSQSPIHTPKYVANMLEHFTGINMVRDIRLCDGGAVADVPNESVEAVLEASRQAIERNPGRAPAATFEVCTELPELELIDNGLPPRKVFGRMAAGGGRGGFGSRDGGGGRGGRGSFGSSRGGSSSFRGGMSRGGSRGSGSSFRGRGR